MSKRRKKPLACHGRKRVRVSVSIIFELYRLFPPGGKKTPSTAGSATQVRAFRCLAGESPLPGSSAPPLESSPPREEPEPPPRVLKLSSNSRPELPCLPLRSLPRLPVPFDVDVFQRWPRGGLQSRWRPPPRRVRPRRHGSDARPQSAHAAGRGAPPCPGSRAWGGLPLVFIAHLRCVHRLP